MTYLKRVIRQSRRDLNKQRRIETQHAGIPNILLVLLVSILAYMQNELLILHPSKVYQLNGIRCDEKEAAKFLLRNMQMGFERGQLMIAIQSGRGKFATKRRWE
jgi:hypothetical protein